MIKRNILMSISLILLNFLSTSSLSIAGIIIGEHEITDEQLLEIQKNLPLTQKDYKFYHWTHVVQGIRWAKQGYLDAGEVQFYNTPQSPESLNRDGNLQVYGPGVYLAETAGTSTDFGSYPVIFKVAQGTPI